MVLDNKEQYIQVLEEYIHQGEPSEQKHGHAWWAAIDLQEVDGLKTSLYLQETFPKHIESNITIIEAKQLIDSHYRSQTGRKKVEGERIEESDKVSARIAEQGIIKRSKGAGGDWVIL